MNKSIQGKREPTVDFQKKNKTFAGFSFFLYFFFVGLEILTGDCLHSETVALRLMPLHLFLLPSRRVFVLFFIKYRLPIVIDLALFLSFLLYRVTLLEVYIYIRKHKSQPSAKKERRKEKKHITRHRKGLPVMTSPGCRRLYISDSAPSLLFAFL